MLSDVENILNDDEFLADTIIHQKRVVEQNGKQECLNGVKHKGKGFFCMYQVTENNGHVKRLIKLAMKPSLNHFFFYLGFPSRTLTNHRTAGEGGGHFFNSLL